MKLDRTQRRIVLRASLVAFTAFLWGQAWRMPNSLITLPLLSALLAILVTDLLRYVNRTTTAVSNFVRHIVQEDTSLRFTEPTDDPQYKALNASFNLVIGKMQELKMEQNTHKQLLQTLIEQVDIGLIACINDERIQFINQTARNILGLERPLRNLQALDLFHPGFSVFLRTLQPGSQVLRTLQVGDDAIPVSFKVSIVNLPQQQMRFYSFQSLKSELEQQEIDSWHKLIRVLTHEIMNTITPITTLSHTIHKLLAEHRSELILHSEIIDDALLCSELIEERSRGLMRFVGQYRQLTQKFELQLSVFPLADFLHQVVAFVRAGRTTQAHISIHVSPPQLTLRADYELIKQVLINMLNNAIDATLHCPQPQIVLRAQPTDNARTELTIADNGSGIQPDELEKIFVPFYTTKESGNGIGLSLSKQIVQQHGGTISVKSIPELQTIFRLIF